MVRATPGRVRQDHAAISAGGKRRAWLFCCRKVTENVRKYPAEQGIAEEDGLKKWMEEKSKEFVEKGAEYYAKT